MDPRKARVIEPRFFGGLSVDETAEVLKISPQSVMRDWKAARAWLQREMKRLSGKSVRPGLRPNDAYSLQYLGLLQIWSQRLDRMWQVREACACKASSAVQRRGLSGSS
ncbi:MAG: ECF-type sigma factor [Bryobacteraceae bacterium]|jgi:hypothetical protein